MAIVRSFAMQSAKRLSFDSCFTSIDENLCPTDDSSCLFGITLGRRQKQPSQASLAVDGCIGSHGVAETADWNKSNGLLFAPFHPGQSKSKQTS
ncbi:hypothetical protein T4B_3463 [Trichinella pseudospiralis]|uniref:Uncharacterized protein n=2 Tax=Trichinella pseudospiralis TaxID=6337 RepID=A0A0V1FJV4_TRIPS|nr:hypothetical protein T4A_4841 [Trichinella pseudospiralis]KRY86343.1 hypothetical protein T4D_6758 [Trichinella pseudospiralis]KRZ20499.1 hypothetical protein T4B_3463 [Trichinella pseudospiralis]KRZ35886.1 hypothetical protein T4C_7046 [Trichinella pseudospiralis]